MRVKTLIMILASLSFSVSAFADHHEGGENKPFSIYGDFASSLSFYSFGDQSSEDNVNGSNHDDFNIDLVEVNLEKNWSKSKLHLSIGYGTTAVGVNPLIEADGTPRSNLNLMNAYYHMNTSYGLGFTFGKFESPVGYETYTQMDNSQYTRSYGFNLAPFFSTGLMVDYGQDMWKAGFVVSNGSGRDTDTYDKSKTMALVIDVDPMENLHVDLNYVTGTEGTSAGASTNQVNLLDVSVAYTVNEMFDVALNYMDNGQKPSGGGTDVKATSVAAYVNANLGMFGLGLRYEMFTYDNKFTLYNGSGPVPEVVGEDNSINSITLAAKAEIDQNAIFLIEYRQESADDQGTFKDKDRQPDDTQSRITAALMYRF